MLTEYRHAVDGAWLERVVGDPNWRRLCDHMEWLHFLRLRGAASEADAADLWRAWAAWQELRATIEDLAQTAPVPDDG